MHRRLTLARPRPLRAGRAQLAGVLVALALVGALGAVEARTPPSITFGGFLVIVVLASTWLFAALPALGVAAAALCVPVVAYVVGSDDIVAAEVEVLAIIVLSVVTQLAVGAVEEYARLLAARNRELVAVNASLERFTADAAHEFRAPLSVVLSEVDIALARAGSVEEQRRHLRSIRAEVTHMQSTISGLLTLARADAGRLQAAFRSIDLVDLLEELAARWRPLAARRGVEVETALPEQGTIVCDRDLVVRVVDNLVDNAVRATPRAGTVRVSARRDAEDWVLTVANPGAMPAPEVLAALGAGETPGPGSASVRPGLGLALCAAIARVHGGSITAGGDGATTAFVVRLPARDGASPS